MYTQVQSGTRVQPSTNQGTAATFRNKIRHNQVLPNQITICIAGSQVHFQKHKWSWKYMKQVGRYARENYRHNCNWYTKQVSSYAS